jgi:hypothetical protein
VLLENNVRLVRTALEALVMTTPICFFSKELSTKLILIIKDVLKDLPAKIKQMKETDVDVTQLEASEADLKERLEYC